MNFNGVNRCSDRSDRRQRSLKSSLLLAGWLVWSAGIWAQGRAWATVVALQHDGKLVVAGTSDPGFAVVRYRSNGQPDASFGTKGMVRTRLEDDEQADDVVRDVALQADGKIVVIGRAWQQYSTDMAVVRYNQDGSLDPSFGNEGKVITDLSANYDDAFALVVQADGKLVVGGLATGGVGLVRYNPDGSADFSFNSRVMVTRSKVGRMLVYTLAIQHDGKIVVVGRSSYDNTGLSEFVLARYNPDGNLDSSFGLGGAVTHHIGTVDTTDNMALQPDGKIVVVGRYEDGHRSGVAVVRYHTDGSLDSSFGSGGMIISDLCAALSNTSVSALMESLSGPTWAVRVQADGKIVVTGMLMNPSCHGFLVLRYTAEGHPDRSFGTKGKVRTVIGTRAEYAGDLTLQPDGKIVVVGTSEGSFAVVRYNPDGSLDPTFGTQGKVTTQVSTDNTKAAEE